MKNLFALFIILLFVPIRGLAEAPVLGERGTEELLTLEFHDVWARKSLTHGANSAIYMEINNPTDKEYVIRAAESEVAENTELHESFVDENGIARMMALDKIVVPARARISLKPKSLHIMLLGLQRTLKEGDKIQFTLEIEDSDPVALIAVVK